MNGARGEQKAAAGQGLLYEEGCGERLCMCGVWRR